MGQYRLAFYFKWQIGFVVSVEDSVIGIRFPFVSILIGLLPDARGVRFFWEALEDTNE